MLYKMVARELRSGGMIFKTTSKPMRRVSSVKSLLMLCIAIIGDKCRLSSRQYGISALQSGGYTWKVRPRPGGHDSSSHDEWWWYSYRVRDIDDFLLIDEIIKAPDGRCDDYLSGGVENRLWTTVSRGFKKWWSENWTLTRWSPTQLPNQLSGFLHQGKVGNPLFLIK